ncbi:MAG: SAM-dependent methyltransferase [Sinimarinibacterium flocculans]|uniref:SAM-dependent methyltransferase n=1 Tax=Sinimarinibacterium flocculans TaxID=985250 RepID=UPI0024913FBC|nr:class I SAM-dependent methyltransferase [Sinimarinibacterium flocculans]
MTSEHTQGIVKYYTRRHTQRRDAFDDRPYANYGYWTRPGLSMADAAEAMAGLVAGAAGLCPQDEVLEVGCGYGACAVRYASAFGAKSIVGIDITPTRVEHGNDYVKQCGLADAITLRLGDATKLDFADASFDKLLAVECAFHFDTRRDFLREAGRVLRPGGTLVLTDLIPKVGADLSRYVEVENRLAADIEMYNPKNAYDAEVYAGYLRESGFAEVRIDSILPWTLARFIPACREYAQRPTTVDGDKVLAHAEKLQAVVDAGEDYVLVVARKAESARGSA